MTSYLETVLAEKFRSMMMDPILADRVAAVTAGTIKALDLVPRQAMDAFELDAKIYGLRGKRVAQPDMIARLGICKRRIYIALVRHAKRRRAMLLVRIDQSDNSLENAG